MSFETLLVERDARDVVTVTLNRPEKRNALSGMMIAELTEVAGALDADPAVRAVVLQGAGEAFCAGGDLGWMKAQVEASRMARMAEARKLARMLGALNAMRAPLIGAVQGAALGGGAGLAAVCDMVVATTDARFGFTETRLGLIPATIGPYVVARIGEGAARRLFASARIFGAAEAERIGLTGRSVDPDDLAEAVAEEIAPYLRVAPGAARRAKTLALRLGSPIDEAVVEASIEALADAWETEEARLGIAAFLDKKPPPWAG